MGIGGYITIIKLAAKFSRAYSKAIKAEEARDGNVSWLDYITCVLDALETMGEDDLGSIVDLIKTSKSKK